MQDHPGTASNIATRQEAEASASEAVQAAPPTRQMPIRDKGESEVRGLGPDLRAEDLVDINDFLRKGSPVVNDAGARAAERIRAKAAIVGRRAARIAWWLIIGAILIALLGVGGVAYYGWTNRITGHYTDERPCSAPIGDKELIGVRSYTYPYTEIFGFQIRDTKKITEKTTIRLNGSGLHITGITGDDWWALTHDQGETGQWIIKSAEKYVFFSGGKTNVVPYKAFCK